MDFENVVYKTYLILFMPQFVKTVDLFFKPHGIWVFWKCVVKYRYSVKKVLYFACSSNEYIPKGPLDNKPLPEPVLTIQSPIFTVCPIPAAPNTMMALWYGNAFPITGSLWAESRWIPLKRPITHSFYVSVAVNPNKRLNKRFSHRCFEVPWRSRYITVKIGNSVEGFTMIAFWLGYWGNLAHWGQNRMVGPLQWHFRTEISLKYISKFPIDDVGIGSGNGFYLNQWWPVHRHIGIRYRASLNTVYIGTISGQRLNVDMDPTNCLRNVSTLSYNAGKNLVCRLKNGRQWILEVLWGLLNMI